MKIKILITIIFLSILQSVMAQDSLKMTYPLVVSFESHCCGVPAETSLRSFITSYKKKYKIKKLIANRVGPMGREGEYYIAFTLKELNKKQMRDFISMAKKIKPLKSDKGAMSFKEYFEIDPANVPQRAKARTVVF
ncbi:hypothetical protein BH11BAC4_BH11BAC4_27340 [soil metagenome]